MMTLPARGAEVPRQPIIPFVVVPRTVRVEHLPHHKKIIIATSRAMSDSRQVSRCRRLYRSVDTQPLCLLRCGRPEPPRINAVCIADGRAPGGMSADRAGRSDRPCHGRDSCPGTSQATVPIRSVPRRALHDEVVASASPAVERAGTKPCNSRAGSIKRNSASSDRYAAPIRSHDPARDRGQRGTPGSRRPRRPRQASGPAFAGEVESDPCRPAVPRAEARYTSPG